MLTAFLLVAPGCKDQTFEQIPAYSLSKLTKIQELLKDSTVIDQGLFYRQLTEHNYQNIYGHLYLDLDSTTSEENHYNLVFLSTEKEHENTGLICSVDPVYHSLIDVMTFKSNSHKIISIQKSSMSGAFIDIKLLDISKLTRRPDTLLIQSNSDGKFEKIPLCCDF